MFSIFILTHNEELDIAACIESALQATDPSKNDVIVVDSFSNDRTVEIASRYPVRVMQHAFESHGKQRTWMLRHVATAYDWVYILEADERMTPELFSECLKTVENPEHIGYFAAERVMFMGQWIKHSTQYPRYQMRLFDKARVWFSDYGHTEREECNGSTGYLTETYPHYTQGKGFERWFDKHNTYSTNEAKETLKHLEQSRVNWSDLFFGKTEVDRRHALKDLSQRVPLRPLVRFIYMYVFLRGFLDGRAGFAWCTLQAFYEYMIVLKVWESQHLPVPSLIDSEPAEPLSHGVPLNGAVAEAADLSETAIANTQ
ncbi:glycosyltransferase family 2 protein [filamentous cyanobacterium LEGE 11480]|uniref:Glycosyltransferase family 2 protein n=1 Tax=Romeriopsis navalis LEGE 11480 TaxID=2777977 RepID=A0A928VPD2_9CYAN|nr:glycosyltransferase family 2 protein [Romeriopsis navalis]MBE9032323.1 glycosyltransferase family 2 protein [Romeriopsis navalis LEGE 11480]